jgi:hypothetical protein
MEAKKLIQTASELPVVDVCLELSLDSMRAELIAALQRDACWRAARDKADVQRVLLAGSRSNEQVVVSGCRARAPPLLFPENVGTLSLAELVGWEEKKRSLLGLFPLEAVVSYYDWFVIVSNIASTFLLCMVLGQCCHVLRVLRMYIVTHCVCYVCTSSLTGGAYAQRHVIVSRIVLGDV